jgi:hypothetical protein
VELKSGIGAEFLENVLQFCALGVGCGSSLI